MLWCYGLGLALKRWSRVDGMVDFQRSELKTPRLPTLTRASSSHHLATATNTTTPPQVPAAITHPSKALLPLYLVRPLSQFNFHHHASQEVRLCRAQEGRELLCSHLLPRFVPRTTTTVRCNRIMPICFADQF